MATKGDQITGLDEYTVRLFGLLLFPVNAFKIIVVLTVNGVSRDFQPIDVRSRGVHLAGVYTLWQVSRKLR